MSLAHLPPEDLLLSVSVDVPSGRIRLSGDLDHASAHLLVDALPVLAAGRSTVWRIDAAAVTFCDAGGLAALVEAQRYAATQGRRIVVVSAGRCIRRLIEVTGVQDLIPVVAAAGPADRG